MTSQVSAFDPDVDRDTNLRYALSGQFADDGTFTIDPYRGEISLTRALDRDAPDGRAEWSFNVLAFDEFGRDECLTGYAQVVVKPRDINDNAPVFNRNFLHGRVSEDAVNGEEYIPQLCMFDYKIRAICMKSFEVLVFSSNFA